MSLKRSIDATPLSTNGPTTKAKLVDTPFPCRRTDGSATAKPENQASLGPAIPAAAKAWRHLGDRQLLVCVGELFESVRSGFGLVATTARWDVSAPESAAAVTPELGDDHAVAPGLFG
jgi:hypothetical protein